MSTQGFFTVRSRMFLTILVTMGWLAWGLCWMAFAWSRYSFFQNLVCLGNATLLFAAITGIMWVVDPGLMLVATILTTIGGLSFILYWIGFAWSRHTLLQNGAVLMLSLSIVAGLCLVEPSDPAC